MGKRRRKQKKAKKQITKNCNEFRKLHTRDAQGHMQYVCGESKKSFESVGITHGKRTKGVKNVPLNCNPDKNDPDPSYVRPNLVRASKKKYGNKLSGVAFNQKDQETVWKLIESLRKKKKS